MYTNFILILVFVFEKYVKKDVESLFQRFIDNHANWKRAQILIKNNIAREPRQEIVLSSNEISTQTSNYDLNSTV